VTNNLGGDASGLEEIGEQVADEMLMETNAHRRIIIDVVKGWFSLHQAGSLTKIAGERWSLFSNKVYKMSFRGLSAYSLLLGGRKGRRGEHG
jgi:hypothetical protein